MTLANVNYALCSDVTLDEIVSDMCLAVRYFAQHAVAFGAAAHLFLIGHSAGAHLIARLLAQDRTAAGLPAGWDWQPPAPCGRRQPFQSVAGSRDSWDNAG